MANKILLRTNKAQLVQSQFDLSAGKNRFQVDVGMKENVRRFVSGQGQPEKIPVERAWQAVLKQSESFSLLAGLGCGYSPFVSPDFEGRLHDIVALAGRESAVEFYDISMPSPSSFERIHALQYPSALLQNISILPMAQLLFVDSAKSVPEDESTLYVGKVTASMQLNEVLSIASQEMGGGRFLAVVIGSFSELRLMKTPKPFVSPQLPSTSDSVSVSVESIPSGSIVASIDTDQLPNMRYHAHLGFTYPSACGGHVLGTVVAAESQVLMLRPHEYLSVD